MMRPQSADIIDLLLRVLSLIGKQVAMYIQSQTKREKIVKEILQALENILTIDLPAYLVTVIDSFDISGMCEMAVN